MRVEIIGGMGVGKTTFCNAIERIGFSCVFEALEKNPYVDLSYQDPETYGFYSQISFILGNFFTTRQKKEEKGITIFDYSTVTDKAYASLFLNGKARDIALQMIEFLEEKEGLADLYLYLTCSPQTQLERIRSRGRDYEAHVNREFLEALDSYTLNSVHKAQRAGSKIMTIDTEEYNFAANREDIAAISKAIFDFYDGPQTKTSHPVYAEVV